MNLCMIIDDLNEKSKKTIHKPDYQAKTKQSTLKRSEIRNKFTTTRF